MTVNEDHKAYLDEYECPRCKKEIKFHQIHCSCGMNIDWTFGLTVKPNWKKFPPVDDERSIKNA